MKWAALFFVTFGRPPPLIYYCYPLCLPPENSLDPPVHVRCARQFPTYPMFALLIRSLNNTQANGNSSSSYIRN